MTTNTKFGTVAKREAIVRFDGVIITTFGEGFVGDTVTIGN